MRRYASSAASALLGAALAAIAFAAGGGFQLDRLTWTQIAIVIAGALLIAIALLRGRRGPLNGAITLGAFVALAALVAISISWSIAPANSWLEANLTISYVLVFAAGAAIARLAKDGWAIVLRAIVLAVAAVVVYALATRVWPTLDANDIFARLGAPYSYWNALGATAALGVAPALWLGARRSGHAPVNAFAYPLLALIWVAIFLSYSRAAIAVAAIGALIWIVFVPLRLRSITLLGISLAGAAPIVVWALQKDAFTKNAQPLAVRQAVASQFGFFLLATIIITVGAGLAIGFGIARRPPRAIVRLRVGVAAGAVACALPVAMFVVLANSDRGLTGTIKSGYESLTSTSTKTSGGPGRLLSASSSRSLYWHQAKKVFESHYWKGTGADTFGVARLRFRAPSDQSVSQHAHGYVHQTASDLGTAGLLVSLVLLVSWLIATARTLGVRVRRRGPPQPWSAERVGVVALALAAVVFGLHSAIDWIWFVPGPTIMAVLAAGFVAGRGPLAAPESAAVATRGAEIPALAPAAAVPAYAGAAIGGGVATAPPPPPPPPPSGYNGSSADAPTSELPAQPPRRRPSLPGPLRRVPRPALAVLVVAVSLLCAWTMWLPLHSDQETDHALDLAAEGKTAAALTAVRSAHDDNPLTPRPDVVESSVLDGAGKPQAARATLENAVKKFPGDPQVWLQLAQYELNTLNKPADALAIIQGALYLDPQSRANQALFFQANNLLHPPQPPPAAPAPAPAPTPAPSAKPQKKPRGGG